MSEDNKQVAGVGTIRLVIMHHPYGIVNRIFVSEEVLTADQVLAHIRDVEGFTGDVSVYDNMQHVTVVPPQVVPTERVEVVHRFTNAVLCRGSSVRDAVIGAVTAGISLAGAHLEGADLSGMNLTGVDFYEAGLRGADFSRSDVTHARFAEADMSGANMSLVKGFKMPIS